ncbi:phosphoribosylanthranilate isomerase [Cohnella endophytica]|uniref:N-(5'-phosphoribosyl)anthranilate isomerase n=1 Tax=Cohnella endophytica TaxID=2419778 RepID=A0A494Y2T3_9BACL|nr:phosphoribosylanthranilate isomerase [Cohnella endophytica]RKP57046.1 phosphoribosylanthranilate isomerase [Cohnella endophytica]
MTQRNSSGVKICGIKEEATLRGMNGLPVDYIGFVFAKSRRQLTPEQAGKLHEVASQVPMAGGKPPLTVGVFVNPTMEQLEETLASVPLNVVQLHGEETPAFSREIGERFNVEVWRALPITEQADADSRGAGGAERLAEYKGAVSTILLDTAGGGTGKTFRWDVIPAYQAAAQAHGLRLFVAGGLTPDNADDLIRSYRPDGVDISSGVETDGTKDNDKIAAFAERVASS